MTCAECLVIILVCLFNVSFKLESPNLDQKCKTPWWRSCFTSWLIFKVKCNSKEKHYHIFLVYRCLNSKPIEVRIAKFVSKIHLNTIKIPINWLIGQGLQFNFWFQNIFFSQTDIKCHFDTYSVKPGFHCQSTHRIYCIGSKPWPINSLLFSKTCH